MTTLTQNKLPMRSQYQFHTCPSPLVGNRMHSSATATTKSKTEPDHPEIEPRLTTAPRPIDPSILSTWSHRAWLTSGCTVVLISLIKSIVGVTNSHIWLSPTLAGLVGYVVADLWSGVYHWVIDNYGCASTPFFGNQIEEFQGHHMWPRAITKRQFANNLHALGRAVTFIVLPIDLLCDNPIIHGFVSVCFGCILFSQQFHAWAHSTKSQLPSLVVALQDLGILLSRSQHTAHHHRPYNSNYCIISGIWNNFLDNQKVFKALEMFLFLKLGVRPRSWSEPNSE